MDDPTLRKDRALERNASHVCAWVQLMLLFSLHNKLEFVTQKRRFGQKVSIPFFCMAFCFDVRGKGYKRTTRKRWLAVNDVVRTTSVKRDREGNTQ